MSGAVDYAPWPWSLVDDVVRVELRAMWWHLHRLGVRLPAEPGIILIEGG